MTQPSVSCICITRHRRFFVRQAVKYFRRAKALYDGPSELVIVDGSEERNPEWERWPVYLHVPEPSATRQTSCDQIGYYHNLACERAKGDIIIKWDDDDWQSPFRIDRQARLLSTVDQGFSYSSAFYWYHVHECRAARARSWAAKEGASGSTFAFHKSAWKKSPFPDKGVEDGPFALGQMHVESAFLNADDPELLVYMRHHSNGSPLTHYDFTDDATYQCRSLLRTHGDLAFYDELSEILPFQPWNDPNGPGSKARVLSPLQRQWARHFR